MLLTLHLADVGVRRAPRLLRRAPSAPGLRWAHALTAAPLTASYLPRPTPGRVGLLAAWDGPEPYERYVAAEPEVGGFSGGYEVALRPTRLVGSWPGVGREELDEPEDGSPVVITLGRVRARRALAFLRASADAEAGALASSGLVMATALARPPGLVATFSQWSDVEAMRAYVTAAGGPGHASSMRAHAADPFHSAAAFIRGTVVAQRGSWA